MRRRPAWTAVLMVLGSAGAALTAAAAETYVGTVAVSEGKPASIKVTIKEYTSDDRAFALAETLHKSGNAAAVAEMLKGDAGTVQVGDKGTLRAALVRLEKTTDGRLVRIVTDRPLHGEKGALPPDAVGYVELHLDSAGNGSGRVLTAVKATFDADGFVVPESIGETWAVTNVKPGP